MALKDELADRAALSAKSRPVETNAAFDAGIAAIAAAGIADHAVAVGDPAPDFVLPDTVGRSIALADLVRTGPTIVTFYRGGWCPYCNLELRAYQSLLPELTEAGVNIVAISPQRVDAALATVKKYELDFSVLTDLGNVVASQFRIVHAVDADVRAIYERSGHDLATIESDRGPDTVVTLPLPATFLIDADLIVRLAFVSADYKERAEPSEVLAAARAFATGDIDR
jgi:peroxiredoxin